MILQNELGPHAYSDGDDKKLRADALYFGESQTRMIVTVCPKNKEVLVHESQKLGIQIFQLGKVCGDQLVLGDRIALSVSELSSIYERSIPESLEDKKVRS